MVGHAGRPGRELPRPTIRWAADGHRLPSGVRRISLPARLIPFTGGYRAVLPGPVTDLLARLEPDAIEVSDRLTLRSLGPWGRRHGVATVMISHERLDRLAGQVLPRALATAVADIANRRTAPLGVDLEQFHPRRHSPAERGRWAAPEQTLLVHCGRLSVEKHVHRSIDTVAALRDSGMDVRLVVVGEGPLRTRLERQAARLPVDFAGYVTCRDTMEALACGTPVVVSNTSALAEILTTASGAATDYDPHAIAHAVASVIARPEHTRRHDARRRAEDFPWPRSATGMLSALSGELRG